MRIFIRSIVAVLATVGFGQATFADKSAYLDLARRGWNYELRSTMLGRDMSIPVQINGRNLAESSLCLVGEPPHPQTRFVLHQFRDLVREVFDKPLPMRYAGEAAHNCGESPAIIIRLYSGYPPNDALSADLHWMSEKYGLGLPKRRIFSATSPAMAQTFFGRLGQGTHIMVKQPGFHPLNPLEKAFYASILVEELFQSFTFGMDILIFDRSATLHSKLQETPLNLQRLPWESQAFMRALLGSNPSRLCAFDVFMLHAVAKAPVDQTTEPEFIEFIDRKYDLLSALAETTMQDPRFATIIDPTCRQS